MNVQYETKPEMTLIGFHTTILPEEGYQKCPEFWDKAFAARYTRLWQTMQPKTPVEAAILQNNIGMYAICEDGDHSFEYWIAGIYQGGEVPDGLSLYTFPASAWAMFTAKGPIPSALQALNTAVWHEWLPNEGKQLQANEHASLEVYTAGNPQSLDYECGIWFHIGIMPKTV